MLKKYFFGWSVPRIEYEVLPAQVPEPDQIAASNAVTLLHPKSNQQNLPALYRVGDMVNTGQKISLFADDPAYVIATATGRITSISPFTGDYGKSYLAITIKIAEDEVVDNEFETIVQNPTLEGAIGFLNFAPGMPPLSIFADPQEDIKTIVINGIDSDLLIGTNQFIIKSRLNAVKRGIQALKSITGIENIILTVAGETLQGYGHLGVDVKAVNINYPSALPQLIMKDVLGQILPAGQRCEDLGVCFFSAEAVASLGAAFNGGGIPLTKVITLINKDYSQKLIEARIGTPLKDILNKYGLSVNEKDRIIFGGPMRGLAIYSLEHPIQADTDAIMILDQSEAAYASDYPCVNCGECVRTCPADIQVNLLVRFLEAGQYEEGADYYDLLSCVDCGLCSYVCISKIPIFQYIKLAKYELKRAHTAEAANG